MGEFGKAIADLTEAIRLNAKDAVAYHNRSVAFRHKGELPNALADLTEALRLNPDPAAWYDERGDTYFERREFDKAIADYTQAIALGTGRVGTYMLRGIAYGNKGQLDSAIADFTEAIRLDPGNAEAYADRGAAFLRAGERDKAIADFTEAIRLNPNYDSAYSGRGSAYAEKGDQDRAIADYTEAVRLNIEAPDNYFRRGVVYKKQGDISKAEADFVQAETRGYKPMSHDWGSFRDLVFVNCSLSELFADPGSTSPKDELFLAWSFVKGGKAHEAKELLERVLVDPEREVRDRLLTWRALRGLGEQPPKSTARQVQGVVLEFPTGQGVDTLAAYADGRVRYLDTMGPSLSFMWEIPGHAIVNPLVLRLMDAAKILVTRAEAHGTHKPTRLDVIRASVLTYEGLFISEATESEIRSDASHELFPVYEAGRELLKTIRTVSSKQSN